MAVDEIRFRVMASEAHVIVVEGSPDACTTAQRALEQLELTWSRFVDSSDISRLNNNAGRPLRVDPTTITLIEIMAEARRMTDGRYNPTVLPALLSAGYVASIDDPGLVTSLPGGGRTPTGPRSFDDLVVEPNGFVTMPTPLALDAGGIGKGLAADLVVAELLARGAGGALVSVGGDLAAAGNGPEVDGWRIAIEDAIDPRLTLAQIVVSGGGVATSSTLTRRWTNADTACHHVIDPATDEPSQTDLVAVTVFASCGWQAEAHATALLLGGAAHFDEYTRSRRIDALATTTAGSTVATEALAEMLPKAEAQS